MPSVIQRIGETERKYVLDVLADGFSSATGAKYMTKLESAFAEKYGSKFAVSFVNGTATLHAALEAAGIGCKDEVIVPPLTMSSTSLSDRNTVNKGKNYTADKGYHNCCVIRAKPRYGPDH